MKWFWKKRKPIRATISDNLIKDEKILDRLETDKVKGGRTNKNRIWNGCGGMIPQ